MNAVVFDMDGVMFDTERLAIKAWDWIGEQMGIGKVGYMAEIEPDELALLDRLFDKNYTSEKRMLLDAKVIRDGKTECVDKFAIDKDGSGTVTDETPDILPDEVEDEEVNVLETVFKYFKKIINIAWNIFKMYFIDWKH